MSTQGLWHLPYVYANVISALYILCPLGGRSGVEAGPVAERGSSVPREITKIGSCGSEDMLGLINPCAICNTWSP